MNAVPEVARDSDSQARLLTQFRCAFGEPRRRELRQQDVKRVVVAAVALVTLTACGAAPSESTASAEGSPTASEDACTKVDTLLFDAMTTGGARSAEEAATRFVESHQQRDSRYAGGEDEWRVISGDGSDERQLRSGDVQVGVARGTDGTWHLLGAALCDDA